MSGGEIEMKAGDDVEVMSSHKIGTVDEARLDVAVNFLALHQHEYGSYTDAEARVVLRKIDWIMLPMMFVTSTICALDVRRCSLVLPGASSFSIGGNNVADI